MWWMIVAIVVGVVALAAWVARAYGARRWRAQTAAVVARLQASQPSSGRSTFDPREVDELPRPVARYFQAVLRPGQPIIVAARVVHSGRFRTGDADNSWRPFASTETFSARPPGFVWDARIRMAPGLRMHVRDAYVDGAGFLRGEMLGLVPRVDVHDKPELTAGALQRYLAEAVWLPTALLPSQGIEWAAIDDMTARATLRDGPTTVSLDFRFNAAGEITGAFTASRFREVRGAYEPTPWSCRYAAYADRGGVRIPLESEVEWRLPNRRLAYWRGRITDVTHTVPATNSPPTDSRRQRASPARLQESGGDEAQRGQVPRTERRRADD